MACAGTTPPLNGARPNPIFRRSPLTFFFRESHGSSFSVATAVPRATHFDDSIIRRNGCCLSSIRSSPFALRSCIFPFALSNIRPLRTPIGAFISPLFFKLFSSFFSLRGVPHRDISENYTCQTNPLESCTLRLLFNTPAQVSSRGSNSGESRRRGGLRGLGPALPIGKVQGHGHSLCLCQKSHRFR